jgi:hypothetical protein
MLIRHEEETQDVPSNHVAAEVLVNIGRLAMQLLQLLHVFHSLVA